MIGCALVAAALVRSSVASAWRAAAGLSASVFLGFVLSRTVGLPSYKESDWELIGIVSLALEAGYLVLLAAREWQPVARAASRPVPAARERRDDRRRVAA